MDINNGDLSLRYYKTQDTRTVLAHDGMFGHMAFIQTPLLKFKMEPISLCFLWLKKSLDASVAFFKKLEIFPVFILAF